MKKESLRTLGSIKNLMETQNQYKADAIKARIRNGIETIPSILRRKYHVDDMPVRGKLKIKIRFGFKMLALNFTKLWLCTKGSEKCRAFNEISTE